MSHQSIPNHQKESFVAYMSAWDSPDMADGAWMQHLQEGAAAYMNEHNIKGDSHDALMQYLRWIAEFEE